MSRLSDTILRGSEGVANAYAQLGAVRAQKARDKAAAFASLGAGLADLGKGLAAYGSMRDAKAAETEIAEIESGDQMGATLGAEKRIVALEAFKPKTAAGAKLLASKKREAMEDWRWSQTDKINKAQEAREASDADRKNKEREVVKAAVTRQPLRDPVMQEWFSSGYGTAEGLWKYRQEEMELEKQREKDAAIEARSAKDRESREKQTAARIASTEAIRSADREQRKTLGERGMAIREEGNRIADARLDVYATHMENRARMENWRANFDDYVAMNANRLKSDEQALRWTKDVIDSNLDAAKIALKQIQSESWQASDEENKASLVRKAQDVVSTLESQSKLLDKLAPKGFSWDAPEVPELTTQPTQGGAAPAPATTKPLQSGGKLVKRGGVWVRE